MARDAGRPSAWAEQRAEHVDRGCLAGTVGSEEGEQLTRTDLDVEPVHRSELAKAFD
jgi:hypothetical protein